EPSPFDDPPPSGGGPGGGPSGDDPAGPPGGGPPAGDPPAADAAAPVPVPAGPAAAAITPRTASGNVFRNGSRLDANDTIALCSARGSLRYRSSSTSASCRIPQFSSFSRLASPIRPARCVFGHGSEGSNAAGSFLL